MNGQLIRWIEQQFKVSAKVAEVIPLVGGISSSMYRITVRFLGDHVLSEDQYVIRVIFPTDGLAGEAGLMSNEASILSYLSKLNVKHSSLFPKLIAYDDSGNEAGLPILIMSYINGNVTLPISPSLNWLEQLASAIAKVHLTPIDDSLFKRLYYPYVDVKAGQNIYFYWQINRNIWKDLYHLIASRLDRSDGISFTPSIIHRDYHPTNVLWNEQQKVVGIVDWTSACVGPIGVDVGHCRINLVQLYGLEVANQFLEAYCLENKDFIYDPYWDARCLIDMVAWDGLDIYPGWLALGYEGLTIELIVQRIEQYAEYLVQLMHTNRYSM